MDKREILDEVWKQHRENKDSSHELKEHFCRSCLELTMKLCAQEVDRRIDDWKCLHEEAHGSDDFKEKEKLKEELELK